MHITSKSAWTSKKLHNCMKSPVKALFIPDPNLFKVKSKKQKQTASMPFTQLFFPKKVKFEISIPGLFTFRDFWSQKRTSNLKIIVCEFQFASSGDEELDFRFLLTSVQGQRTAGRVIMDMPCENWTQLSHQPTKLASRSETLWMNRVSSTKSHFFNLRSET